MRIIGIDPDLSGGMVLVEYPAGNILIARGVPVLKKKPPIRKHSTLDTAAIWDFLIRARGMGAEMVVLESASIRPGQGHMVRIVEHFGMLRALSELAFTPSRLMVAYPHVWKKSFELTKDKALSRELAIQMHPGHEPLLSKVKNTGVAEALLMTKWAFLQRTHVQ